MKITINQLEIIQTTKEQQQTTMTKLEQTEKLSQN